MVGFLALLICASALLTACNNPTETDTESAAGGDVAYTVNVSDYLGNAVDGVVVNLLKNGEQVAMKRLINGSATFTEAPGEYTFTVVSTDSETEYYYDPVLCVLSAEKTAASITLYEKLTGEPREIFARLDYESEHEAHDAYFIGEGATYVELNAGARTFFLFTPERSGTFLFDVVGASDAVIGYFGGTFNVLVENQAERKGTAIELEFVADQVGNLVSVLAVDSEIAENCVITVRRVGDVTVSIHDLPWTSYVDPDYEEYFANCANWEKTGFVPFNITDPTLSAVYNEEDGYYHLNAADGPVLFVRLGEASDYLASFETVCETSRMGAYIYDEDGNFVTKESYNELFIQHSFATVPLTEEIAHAIKNHGASAKWWDMTYDGNLFANVAATLVGENAWLFACGTFEGEGATGKGTADRPVALENDAIHLRVDDGEEVRVSVSAATAVRVSLVDGAKVVYRGTALSAVGGEITFTLSEGELFFTVVGSGDADFITVEKQ